MKRTQASVSAKILESDSDTNGAYDNEKNYTEGRSDAFSGSSTVASESDNALAAAAAAAATSKSSNKKKKSAASPPTKQFIPESPSMPKIDDPVTPSSLGQNITSPPTTPNATGSGNATNITSPLPSASVAAPSSSTVVAAATAAQHDNSVASEPSEATTTCSDDVTVVSQLIDAMVISSGYTDTAAVPTTTTPADVVAAAADCTETNPDLADADLPPDAIAATAADKTMKTKQAIVEDSQQPPPLPLKNEATKAKQLETGAVKKIGASGK